MPTSLPALEMPDSPPGTHYACKASLIGAPNEFELTDDGLSWRVRGKSGVWPYAGIASVRLTYRPVSMQSRRFRADIGHKNGQSIAVFSTSWQTVALMVPQDDDYRAFITELHRRMAEADSHATLIGGLKPGVYAASVALLALVAIALAGLLARAIATGANGGALFLAGFAALFGWQIGGFIWRNKPRPYGFGDLPKELLP